jgi:hypothetical protein
MRSFRYLGSSLLLGMVILAAKAQEDVLEQLKEIAVIDEKVMMPMRDGEMHTRPVNRVLSASGCRFQPVSYIYG